MYNIRTAVNRGAKNVQFTKPVYKNANRVLKVAGEKNKHLS